jgi:hypothetical protein
MWTKQTIWRFSSYDVWNSQKAMYVKRLKMWILALAKGQIMKDFFVGTPWHETYLSISRLGPWTILSWAPNYLGSLGTHNGNKHIILIHIFNMNVFDILKYHPWKHGNIMNFGLGLG